MTGHQKRSLFGDGKEGRNARRPEGGGTIPVKSERTSKIDFRSAMEAAMVRVKDSDDSNGEQIRKANLQNSLEKPETKEGEDEKGGRRVSIPPLQVFGTRSMEKAPAGITSQRLTEGERKDGKEGVTG